MKIPFFAFLFSIFCLQASPFLPSSAEFSLENRILAKVGKTTLSVLDVKKKMDVFYHKHYPQFYDNDYARFQFYQSSWKPVLNQMIHEELMLIDAKDKDIQVPSGEVHETLIRRFGPNVVDTLEKIGITHAEAEETIRKEMIVQRMTWYFVNQKVVQNVHPADVRKEYKKKYVTNFHPTENLVYRVLSVKGNSSFLTAESLYEKIRSSTELDLGEILDTERKSEPSASITLSAEYNREREDISRSHLSALNALSPGQFSKPLAQLNKKTGAIDYKIFYLKKKTSLQPPSIEEKYEQIRQELMNEVAKKYSAEYMDRLKNLYNISQFLEEIPESFQPFKMH